MNLRPLLCQGSNKIRHEFRIFAIKCGFINASDLLDETQFFWGDFWDSFTANKKFEPALFSRIAFCRSKKLGDPHP